MASKKSWKKCRVLYSSSCRVVSVAAVWGCGAPALFGSVLISMSPARVHAQDEECKVEGEQLAVSGIAALDSDPRRAEQDLVRALFLCPDIPQAMYNLGVLYLRQNRFEEAITQMRNAVEAEELPVYRAGLIKALCLSDQTVPLVIKEVETALALEPTATGVMLDFVKYLTTKNDAEQGYPAVEHYLENHPDDADVRKIFVQSNLRLKNYASALRHLELLVKRSPNDASLLRLYGESLDHEKRAPEAYAVLLRAKELEPDNVSILSLLASVAEETKQTAVAIPTLETLVKIEPSNTEFTKRLGFLLLKEGKKEEAQQYLLKAYRMGAQDFPVIANLGWLAVSQNKFAEALPYYRKAESMEPRNTEVLYNYAIALLKTGDSGRSRQFLEKVLKIDKGNQKAASALASIPGKPN